MPGYCRGPAPFIPRERFVMVYMQAMWDRKNPGKAVREEFGMSLKHYEEYRALLSRHGWMPHGRLEPSDLEKVRRTFRSKLREIQLKAMAREDEEARLERVREIRALRRAARERVEAEKAIVLSPSGRRPVFDYIGL